MVCDGCVTVFYDDGYWRARAGIGMRVIQSKRLTALAKSPEKLTAVAGLAVDFHPPVGGFTICFTIAIQARFRPNFARTVARQFGRIARSSAADAVDRSRRPCPFDRDPHARARKAGILEWRANRHGGFRRRRTHI